MAEPLVPQTLSLTDATSRAKAQNAMNVEQPSYQWTPVSSLVGPPPAPLEKPLVVEGISLLSLAS